VKTRTAALAVFALAYVIFAAFVSAAGTHNVQVVSRIALTLAIVQDGSLRIDAFADRTIDKAYFDGHYYTDKAPGVSLLAVPAVAVARFLTGGRDTTPYMTSYAYVATLSTSVLFGALAVALVYVLAQRLGATPRQAAFGSTVLALATPFFGWSTVLFAHAVSAGLLMSAATLLSSEFISQTRTHWRLILIGLVLGLTVTVDLVAIPAVAIIATWTLWLAGRRGIGNLGVVTLWAGMGGVAGLLPLLVYNQLAFGSPFALGYTYVVGFEGMAEGFFGLTSPDPMKAFALTLGPSRGLFAFAPVLVLLPLGLVRMWQTRGAARLAMGVVVTIFAAFLLVNSSYEYWDGGWSTGPRHLMPAVPFLALAMAFAWPRGWLSRGLAAVLLGLSLTISLVSVVVTMYTPSGILFPQTEVLWPGIWRPEAWPRLVVGVLAWLAAGWLIYRSADTTRAAV
jgi:hypothetical protein